MPKNCNFKFDTLRETKKINISVNSVKYCFSKCRSDFELKFLGAAISLRVVLIQIDCTLMEEQVPRKQVISYGVRSHIFTFDKCDRSGYYFSKPKPLSEKKVLAG
jgi:hypothetical protein